MAGAARVRRRGAGRHGTSTLIEDAPDHRLTLGSNLGAPVSRTTKVHVLTATRADADRVEIRHGPDASEATLPVVEAQG